MKEKDYPQELKDILNYFRKLYNDDDKWIDLTYREESLIAETYFKVKLKARIEG